MAELIQSLTPLSAPRPRTRKQDRDMNRDFVRWLSPATPANGQDAHITDFTVPLMSAEGILILAQAHEEEFAYLSHERAHDYEVTAEKFPGPKDQYAFDFLPPENAHGVVVDREI